MAELLKLKDDTLYIMFEPKDFKWLVEKYMGWDAERYFENLISKLQEEADYNTAKVDTDIDSYEASLESNTRCFQDILEKLKTITDLLNKQRVDKLKLFKVIEQIEKQINNQI